MSEKIRHVLENAEPKTISIDKLELWKEANVRKHDRYANLEELIQNIKATGLQVPLLVKEDEPDRKYLVISGQRRLEACRVANIKDISCRVLKGISLEDAIVLSLSENLYRQPMGDDDLAEACNTLFQKFRTLAQVGRRLGVPDWKVKKYLGYAYVEEEVKKLVRRRQITVQQAINIHSKYNDPGKEIRIAKELAELQDRTQKSKFSEAITQAAPVEDVPQLKKRMETMLTLKEYTLHLPPKTSQVYERIAAERNIEVPDALISALDWYAEQWREGKIPTSGGKTPTSEKSR